MADDGPLWFRGWATGDEAAQAPEFDKVLAALGAKRMVIGHTITSSRAVTPRFNGKLYMIDLGMSAAFPGGRHGWLIFENGQWSARDTDKTVTLSQ
jgi:hypothetical protein